jgi:antitoxin ParD1/3/4
MSLSLFEKIALDESDKLRLRRLRAAIEPAWLQAERGECLPFDLKSILSELDKEAAKECVSLPSGCNRGPI